MSIIRELLQGVPITAKPGLANADSDPHARASAVLMAKTFLFELHHIAGDQCVPFDTLENACWAVGVGHPAQVDGIREGLLHMKRVFRPSRDYTIEDGQMWLTYHGFITLCVTKLREHCSWLRDAIIQVHPARRPDA